jgi:hypothetical protein
MKKVASIGFLVILFIVSSCGSESKAVDLCRCLTEPGNSDWNKENQDACRDAISKEIGVENWEKVNMSENPEISAKFDALAKKCTEGTNNTESNNNSIESTDSKPDNDNSLLISNIGTSSEYIWESIDLKAQVYSTLAFDDAVFRNTVYLMNGKTNSEDFSKMMDLSGPWSAKDKNTANGIIELNNVEVSWFFNDDYSTLTNNKGAIYKRVKVK